MKTSQIFTAIIVTVIATIVANLIMQQLSKAKAPETTQTTSPQVTRIVPVVLQRPVYFGRRRHYHR